MKHLKPYNEAIKDFLQPKSDDDILKSVENLPIKDRLIKGLIYGIKWLVEDSKNKIGDNYLEITRNDFYYEQDTYKINIQIITDDEVNKIINLVDDPNSDKRYRTKTNYEKKCIQFSIHVMEYGYMDYNEWIFVKKDGCFFVYRNKLAIGGLGQEHYITPTLNGLLKLIKDFDIKAKKLER